MRTARAETLADLLAEPIAERRITAWSKACGLRPQTVAWLLDGIGKPQRGTLMLLAKALGVDVERVRAACEASRAAAGKG